MAENVRYLHTDLLEAKYGPISANIVEHTESRRVIDMVDGLGISRTHAVTWFPAPVADDPLQEVRDEIAHGGLIGQTIRNHGYGICKPTIVEGVIAIPEWLRNRFGNSHELAWVNIYQFMVNRPGMSDQLYGVVCEIDSPDFRPTDGMIAEWISVGPESSTQAEKYIQELEQYLAI